MNGKRCDINLLKLPLKVFERRIAPILLHPLPTFDIQRFQAQVMPLKAAADQCPRLGLGEGSFGGVERAFHLPRQPPREGTQVRFEELGQVADDPARQLVGEVWKTRLRIKSGSNHLPILSLKSSLHEVPQSAQYIIEEHAGDLLFRQVHLTLMEV